MLQSAFKTIVSEIASAISLGFQDYHLPTVDDEIGEEAEIRVLSLVALEEFEDTLAIEKIVCAGTERFWVELESIMLRLSSSLDIEPDAVEFPVSCRTISERRHSTRREERQASTLTAITPSHTNPKVSAVMRFAGSFKIKMATSNCKVGPT